MSHLPELRLGERLSNLCDSFWTPQPLVKPQPPDPAVCRSFASRVAGRVRYLFLRAEYALSPQGGLREWLRLNVLVLLLIGIPSIILVPPLAAIAGYLCSIAITLQQGAIAVCTALLYSFGAFALLSVFLAYLRERKPR